MQNSTECSTFEGLFGRALEVDAAFSAQLKTIAPAGRMFLMMTVGDARG